MKSVYDYSEELGREISTDLEILDERLLEIQEKLENKDLAYDLYTARCSIDDILNKYIL